MWKQLTHSGRWLLALKSVIKGFICNSLQVTHTLLLVNCHFCQQSYSHFCFYPICVAFEFLNTRPVSDFVLTE